MKSESVSLDKLSTNPYFKEVIDETLDDRLIYNEGLEFLKQSQLIALYKGDIMIGFFSLDDLGDCVEAHAYIFKNHRRFSVEAIRYIVSSQRQSIKTSVYGTHLHIIKLLHRIGFVTTGTLNNALVKDGKVYNVVELIYTKEISNG